MYGSLKEMNGLPMDRFPSRSLELGWMSPAEGCR